MDLFRDFTLLFLTEEREEVILKKAEKKQSGRYFYYEETCAELTFSLLLKSEEELFFKIQNETDHAIAGFAGVRFDWEHNENGFTLIPGIYYNGNDQANIKTIPHIHLPESPRFDASLSAASTPALFVWDGETKGYHYEPSIDSPAGWNGISLDAANKSLTFYTPAFEDAVYRHTRFDGARPPHIWQPGEIVCFKLKRREFLCNSVSDLLQYVFDKGRDVPFYPAYNTPRVNEKEAVEKVRDWVFRKHCAYAKNGTPMMLNAFNNPEASYPYGGMAEWNIMIGWCCGTMSAFPLLKFGGKYRDFAIQFIDFLAENGDSPSGVKRSVYDGERWMDPNHPEYEMKYDHLRFYCDYLHFLGKCIRSEEEIGAMHESWKADFKRGLKRIVKLWDTEHDFGYYWYQEDEEPRVEKGGTGAGAYCLAALSEGMIHDPENAEIRRVFAEAADEYYRRSVLSGRCNAGPDDILEADDSESIAAMTNAFVNAYLVTKEEKYKEMAVRAAQLFSTWVVSYTPRFPGGSVLEGINVCGGVLANVQNRHIGPGICTNSGRFLHELAQITGDTRYETLYQQIKAAAINCICMYDGELFDNKFNRRFLEGMVTEQINLTDALNKSGETWCVSASWPATAVLLGYTDR